LYSLFLGKNIPGGLNLSGIFFLAPVVAFPLAEELWHTEVLHQDHRSALHFVPGLDEASPQCAASALL